MAGFIPAQLTEKEIAKLQKLKEQAELRKIRHQKKVTKKKLDKLKKELENIKQQIAEKVIEVVAAQEEIDIDKIKNRQRNRYFTLAEKLQLIEDYDKLESVYGAKAEFLRQHNIARAHICQWRRKLRQGTLK